MVVDDKESEIVLGRLPVMVRSDLCWLHSQDKNDCFFDPGGYFLIKGMEKVDIVIVFVYFFVAMFDADSHLKC